MCAEGWGAPEDTASRLPGRARGARGRRIRGELPGKGGAAARPLSAAVLQCSGSAPARPSPHPRLALSQVCPGAPGSAFLGVSVSSVPRALLGMSHCLQYYLILLIIIFLSFFLFFLAISLGFWDLSSPTRD